MRFAWPTVVASVFLLCALSLVPTPCVHPQFVQPSFVHCYSEVHVKKKKNNKKKIGKQVELCKAMSLTGGGGFSRTPKGGEVVGMAIPADYAYPFRESIGINRSP
ncbi:MAG: hypothetical protein Q8K54_08845 [Gallionella sp.]|nr:hypothetical protein [Gallionella sp.]